jgi:ESCRT-II complex subunit VPS22
MRRKIGVGAVKDRLNEQEKYSKMGKSMEDTKISFVKDLMGKFQSSLTEFAMKHRDRINSDTEFRQQFHKMCVSVGVDPLASSKGFWSDLLGVGDFYFDLGVKIIEITVQTRSLNGGIMSVDEVMDKLQQNNSLLRGHIVSDDIMRAVDKIKVLGSGFRIVKIGRNKMIVSVPMEINQDHEIILELAQSVEGKFTKDMLVHGLGWSEERFNRVLNTLLQERMIWIDRNEGVDYFYFPSLWKLSGL